MSEIPPSGSTPPPPPNPPPPPGGPGPGFGLASAPAYAGPEPDKDSKTMAMLANLLGIFGFLGPLIVWLLKKDQSPFVDDQGKEALNFHITLLIGIVAVIALSFVICFFKLLLPLFWITGIIFSVIGAMKANEGIAYRYPFNLRLIK